MHVAEEARLKYTPDLIRPGDLGFLLSPVTVMMMVVMAVRLAIGLGDSIALLCLGRLDHSFRHWLLW